MTSTTIALAVGLSFLFAVGLIGALALAAGCAVAKWLENVWK